MYIYICMCVCVQCLVINKPSFNLEPWQVETMAWHRSRQVPWFPSTLSVGKRHVAWSHFLLRYGEGNGHLNHFKSGRLWHEPSIYMIGFPNHFQTLPGASRSVWSVKLLPGGRTFAGKPIFGMRNGVCAWRMPNLYQFVNTMIKHAGSGVPNFERHV